MIHFRYDCSRTGVCSILIWFSCPAIWCKSNYNLYNQFDIPHQIFHSSNEVTSFVIDDKTIDWSIQGKYKVSFTFCSVDCDYEVFTGLINDVLILTEISCLVKISIARDTLPDQNCRSLTIRPKILRRNPLAAHVKVDTIYKSGLNDNSESFLWPCVHIPIRYKFYYHSYFLKYFEVGVR